jgi:hypothetical protein
MTEIEQLKIKVYDLSIEREAVIAQAQPLIDKAKELEGECIKMNLEIIRLTKIEELEAGGNDGDSI